MTEIARESLLSPIIGGIVSFAQRKNINLNADEFRTYLGCPAASGTSRSAGMSAGMSQASFLGYGAGSAVGAAGGPRLCTATVKSTGKICNRPIKDGESGCFFHKSSAPAGQVRQSLPQPVIDYSCKTETKDLRTYDVSIGSIMAKPWIKPGYVWEMSQGFVLRVISSGEVDFKNMPGDSDADYEIVGVDRDFAGVLTPMSIDDEKLAMQMDLVARNDASSTSIAAEKGEKHFLDARYQPGGEKVTSRMGQEIKGGTAAMSQGDMYSQNVQALTGAPHVPMVVMSHADTPAMRQSMQTYGQSYTAGVGSASATVAQS